MKKRMSRLLSMLLVLAMVLAMAPAVFAAETVTLKNSAAAFAGSGTAADPYCFYVGDKFALTRSFTDATHTRAAVFGEAVTSAAETLASYGSYIAFSTTDEFTANKATFSSNNTLGKVAIYYGCSKVTGSGTSAEYCENYTGIVTSGTTKTLKTDASPVYARVYSKAAGIWFGKTSVTLVKSNTAGIEIPYLVQSSTGSTTTSTASQKLSCDANSLVEVSVDDSTGKIKLKPNGNIGIATLYFRADKGTTHEKTAIMTVEVVDKAYAEIKQGTTVIAKSGDTGKTAATRPGETMELSVAGLDVNGNAVKNFVWSITPVGSTEYPITYTLVDMADTSRVKITGKKAGKVNVKASLAEEANVFAEFDLTVEEPVNSLVLKVGGEDAPSDSSEVRVNGGFTLNAVVDPEKNSNGTLNAGETVWTASSYDVIEVKAGSKKLSTSNPTLTGAQVSVKGLKGGSATITASMGGKTTKFAVVVKSNEAFKDVTIVYPRAEYIARKGSSANAVVEQFNKTYPTVSCEISETAGGGSPLGEYPIPVTWVYADSNASGEITEVVGRLAESDGKYTFDYSRTKTYPNTADAAPVTGKMIVAKVTLSDEAIVSKNAITASKTNGLLAGETVSLSCAAESDPAGATLSYQWKKNGSAIAGATSSTYSFRIPASSEDASANYVITCDVTATRNGKVSPVSASNEVILNVLRDYSISIEGGTTSGLHVGSSTTFTAKVLKKDGSAYSGASVTWSLLDASGNALDSKYATMSNGTVTLRGMSSTSSQTVKIRVATTINGDTYSAEKSISYDPAKAVSVTIPASAAGTLSAKNANKLQSAISSALANSGISPKYIIFGTTSGVTLSKSASGAALGDTHCEFSSGSQLLANVYFKPSTSKATVSYVAYDSNNCVLATGEAIFDPTVASGVSVTASGATFKTSGASAEICTDSAISYVQFTLPEAKDGKLLYNYKSIISNEAVSANNKYYVSGSSSQYLLDNVYFVPAADCAASVKIQYAAYTSAGARTDGELVFNVSKKSNSAKFTDVTEAKSLKWAADSIDFMADSGLVNGTSANKFSPTNNLIRGDLVVMLYRIAGQPSVAGINNPFKDVKQTDYYYNAILWAYSKGVVSGTGATAFSPKKNVTRQDIATILYRYSGKPAATGNLNVFSDRSKVSSYATDAMMWAVGKGYITGTTATTLNPTGNATRAQVAVMLHRFLTK